MNSFVVNIVSDSGLSLTIRGLPTKKKQPIDPSDYHDLHEYEVNNINISDRSFNDDDFGQRQEPTDSAIENAGTDTIRRRRKSITKVKGFMSPISVVNLSEVVRKVAGIPLEAKFYAFLHPPPEIIIHFGNYKDVFKQVTIAEDKWWERPENGDVNNEVLAFFGLFGAFVYFNECLDPAKLHVNVLIPSFKTDKELRLVGPYKTSEVALQGVSDRVKPLGLPSLLECGWTSLSWVRHNETFQGQSISNDAEHGCFVFYKCDGSSAAYSIPSVYGHGDDAGFNIVPDAFDSLSSLANDGICTAMNLVKVDLKECRRNVNVALMQTWQKPSETDNDRPRHLNESCIHIPKLETHGSVLHQAIKSGCDVETVKTILQKFQDELNVSPQQALAKTDPNRWNWNSLHYMCRFHSSNIDVFKYVIHKMGPKVDELDVFGRNPLHIACNKKSCVGVIELLLHSFGNNMAVVETKHLKLLPLHFALIGDCASKGVIQRVLTADEKGISVRAITRTGCNALHIALMSRASYDIIELLLETDHAVDISEEVNTSSEASKTNRIYKKQPLARLQKHRGFSPLHIACLRCLDISIIKLLIDEDTDNGIFDTTNADSNAIGLGSNAMPQETRALHITLQTKSTDATRLLLQIEKQRMSRRTKEGFDVQRRATMVDANNRTCLHLACMNNEELEIIALLLQLDPHKESVNMADKDNMTPLQLACIHEAARKNVIESLLKAQAGRKPEKKKGVSDKRPLALALKARAPTDVLGLLMLRPYFSLAEFDFDSNIIQLLSNRVKNSKDLQNNLNEELAARIPFAFLLFEIVANITVLFTFLDGMNSQFDNTKCKVWVQIVLLALASFFAIYEVIKFRSTPWHYAENLLGNCINWTHIALIYVSSTIFASEPTPDTSPTLLASLVAIVINLMLSLRRAYLPYCYFLGAAFHFMNLMVPFVLISVIWVYMFAYIFIMTSNEMMDGSQSETMGLDEEQKPCAGDGNPSDCFLHLWSTFTGGPRAVNDQAGFLFGLIVSIVFFNIGISIVNSAWQQAKDTGRDYFWRERLVYLQEIRHLHIFFSHIHRFFKNEDAPFFLRIFGGDDMMEKDIIFTYFSLKEINWNEEPYNEVKEKKQYINPHEHFSSSDFANKVKSTRSLRSDVYWHKGHLKIVVVLNCLLFGFLNILLISLGILTFGIVCPKRYRFWVLSSLNVSTDSAVDQDECVVVDK